MLLILFFVALVLRLFLSYNLTVISRDAIKFIQIADSYNEIGFTIFSQEDFHPLFPILIGWLNGIIHNDILAAKTISIMAGALVVVPLFYLIKSLCGKTAAYASVFLYCIHVYAVRFSADPLSEPLYILFFVSGVYFGHKALYSNSWLKLINISAAGLCTGLAFLTRPEAVGLLIILVPFIIIYPISLKKRILSRKLITLVLLLITFSAISFPYLLFLKEHTGEWRLTAKKPLKDFVPSFVIHSNVSKEESKASLAPLQTQQDTPSTELKNNRPNEIEKTKKSINPDRKHPFVTTISTFAQCFSVWVVLMLIGLLFYIFHLKNAPANRLLFYLITTLTLLYSFVLYQLASDYYISKRHMLQLVTLLFGFTGYGLESIYKHFFSKKISPKRFWITVVILLICISGVKTFKDPRSGKAYCIEMGPWLHNHIEQDAVITTDDSRIPFYANVEFKTISLNYPYNTISIAELLHTMKRDKSVYLLVRKDFIVESIPDFYQYIQEEPKATYYIQSKKRYYLLYRL